MDLQLVDTTIWYTAKQHSRYMATVLLTGATGILGQELQPRLLSAGYDVRAASRSPPSDGLVSWTELDLTTGTGIHDAIKGVDIVIHAASDARGDSLAVDVRGTERLLDAAAEASIQNFVYISIVGIDEIPHSYYEHKLEAEQAIEERSFPSTIIRLTQFYPFVAYLLSLVSRFPVWLLPTDFKLQPIDTGDAADAILANTSVDASGQVPDIGGRLLSPCGHSQRRIATIVVSAGQSSDYPYPVV